MPWVDKDFLTEVRSAYERTINTLEAQVTFLKQEIERQRGEHGETRQLLQRALRLEPRSENVQPTREHLEPISGRARNWPALKTKLEAEHRRKQEPPPEDKAAEYWAEKNVQLEKESKELEEIINAGEDSKAV